MKIKLDENLPASAADPLRGQGHDVDTAADEGLKGEADPTVLATAVGELRLLVTMDRGLGDIRSYPPKTHAGILVLRVDNQSARSITQAVTQLCATVSLEDLKGYVSVWRAGMLRIRR